MRTVTPCHVLQTVTSDVPSTLTCYSRKDGCSDHFFLEYSDSSLTIKRHTGAHCQLPQKVIRIDRFLSSIVSQNMVALGGKEGGGVGTRETTPLSSGKASTLSWFSQCCEIDTQQTQSTLRFEITYTLLTVLGLFWCSLFFGFPTSART